MTRINQQLVKVKAHHHPVKLMGCGFVLTAVADSPPIGLGCYSGWRKRNPTHRIADFFLASRF